jgi:hypothetical protein
MANCKSRTLKEKDWDRKRTFEEKRKNKKGKMQKKEAPV